MPHTTRAAATPSGLLAATTALIVVDVQRGFDDSAFWGPRDNPDADRNIASLVDAFTAAGLPMVFVQHDSTNPDSPLHPSRSGNHLKEYLDTAQPDLVVRKSVNSSFHGTPDLNRWLQRKQVDGLVICGITTNHCCETTARVGGNLGYRVLFAADATHTFDRTGPDGRELTADQLAHATCTNLHDEFATVVTTRTVTAALLPRS